MDDTRISFKKPDNKLQTIRQKRSNDVPSFFPLFIRLFQLWKQVTEPKLILSFLSQHWLNLSSHPIILWKTSINYLIRTNYGYNILQISSHVQYYDIFIKIPAQGLTQRPCYSYRMFDIKMISIQTVQKTKKERQLIWIFLTFWETFAGQPLAEISQSTVTYNGRRLKVEDKGTAVHFFDYVCFGLISLQLSWYIIFELQ